MWGIVLWTIAANGQETITQGAIVALKTPALFREPAPLWPWVSEDRPGAVPEDRFRPLDQSSIPSSIDKDA